MLSAPEQRDCKTAAEQQRLRFAHQRPRLSHCGLFCFLVCRDVVLCPFTCGGGVRGSAIRVGYLSLEGAYPSSTFAFAHSPTMAKRLPPDAVEHAAIEKARRRTSSMLKGLGPFCLITGRPAARVRAAVVGSGNAKRGIA